MSWLLFLACWTTAEHDEVQRVSQMFAHDDLALAARDSVLKGDLESVRAAGAALAAQPVPPGLSDEAAPRMALVHRAATALAAAGDSAEAARALGGLAYACGACHRAPAWHRAGDAVPDGVGPPIAHSTATEQHRWGVERMWDGLVWSRDDWYQDGLTVYEQAIERRVAEATLPPEPAVTEEDHQDRSERFGQVLATCASCHERADGPGSLGH